MLLFYLITVFLLQNGARALEGEGIVGGIDVNLEELGYQVSIQVFGLHICGGAIIDERHVVTAAHCIVHEQNDFIPLPIIVVAGTIYINYVEGHEYVVQAAYIPTKFNRTERRPTHDIAVLRLKSRFDLRDPHLSSILLPPSSKGEFSYAGEEALISGFGWDHVEIKEVPVDKNKRVNGGKDFEKIEDGRSSGYMLKAKTFIVSNRECQLYYRNPIIESQLCAKVFEHDESVKQGICSGDSGGPLVHDGKTLVGLVSYNSVGCDDSHRPAVYTRVSKFLGFINNAKRQIVTQNMRNYIW